ncbi:2653_t:CDS:2 [Scutellospora calospora]|uniref:2653_t:CDS:1 n=1 Tax=Scutellospora calospora TaxID=85575 RepID=A0ACA9JV18_9GLOM|nr:2653_t:CDS:2 [Scutellospora calospora]
MDMANNVPGSMVASISSSGSVQRTSKPKVCRGCNKNAALWQVKSEASINKGKWFWKCPVKNFDYQCRFFHWASDSEVADYFRSLENEFESEDIKFQQTSNENEINDNDVQIITASAYDSNLSTSRSKKHLRANNNESNVNQISHDITQQNEYSTKIQQQNDEIILTDNDVDSTWIESVEAELREEHTAKKPRVSTVENNDFNNNVAEDNNISRVETPQVETPETITAEDNVEEEVVTSNEINVSALQSLPTAYLNWENVPRFSSSQLVDIFQSHVLARDQVISELKNSVDFITKQRDQALKDLDEARKQVSIVRREMKRMRHVIDVSRAENGLLRAEKNLLNHDINTLKQKRKV